MRLTNTIRDSFIRAAMDDVPKVAYDDQIAKLIREDAIAQLPPKVRAVYLDKALSHFINSEYSYNYGGISVPCPNGDRFKPTDAAIAQYEKLKTAKEAQEKNRNDLRQKLRGCAYACSTRKALVGMLPEFEKYLPADEVAAARTLPVVANVVSDFVKAGWPKDVKKKKAA